MKESNQNIIIRPNTSKYQLMLLGIILLYFLGIIVGKSTHNVTDQLVQTFFYLIASISLVIWAITTFLSSKSKAKIIVSPNYLKFVTENAIMEVSFKEIKNFTYIYKNLQEYLAIIFKSSKPFTLTRSDRFMFLTPSDFVKPPLPAELHNAIILNITSLGEKQINKFIRSIKENHPQISITDSNN